MGGTLGYVFLAVLIIIILIVILWWCWSSSSGSSTNCDGCVGVDAQKSLLLSVALTNTGDTGTTGPFEIDLDSGWKDALETQITTCRPCSTLLTTVSAVTSAAVFDAYLFDVIGSSSVDIVQIQFRVLVDGTEVTSPDSPITFNEMLHVKSGLSPSESSILTLELLSLAEANTFQWIHKGVCPGCHTVKVQARILLESIVLPGAISTVSGLIGPRTVSVQSIRTCCLKPSCGCR